MIWQVKSRENLTWKSYIFVHLTCQCSHCTLENPKSRFQQYYSYMRTTIYVIAEENKLQPTCPPHLKMTPHCMTCGMQKLLIWLKVCCVLSNIGGSEEKQLWVVIGGCEKNRLWCVATEMPGKQCYSNYSEWPPSALIHASSLFRHWLVA